MKISKKMVNTIIKHINTRGVNNVIILGMDMVGALLASRVAFLLQYPMSYCVSLKNREFNSSDELIIEVKEDYKVIIITESIVTFLTMKETIKSYISQWNSKRKSIKNKEILLIIVSALFILMGVIIEIFISCCCNCKCLRRVESISLVLPQIQGT